METSLRTVPPDMADRLIVALDVDEVSEARALVETLGESVRFFKIGFWLFFKRGVDGLIDELVRDGKHVFLDYKMYDIPETVRRGVRAAAERGISFVTVHGDPDIMEAAVAGRAGSPLKVMAVSVLTSLNDASVAAMGYSVTVPELVRIRVQAAARSGCDGIIASPNDRPDELRRLVDAGNLLVATPGIRMDDDARDDHARAGSPSDAVRNGADYLVVGRPIIRHASPRTRVAQIVAEMEKGQAQRTAS